MPTVSINPIGSNQLELALSDGTVVLFSYKTPVAAYLPNEGGRYITTSTKWSATTTRHVNRWCMENTSTVPQSTLDNLVKVVSHE